MPNGLAPVASAKSVEVALQDADTQPPGQIVAIEVGETTLRIYDQRNHLIKNVPRTSRKEVRRHKVYGHTTNHTTA